MAKKLSLITYNIHKGFGVGKVRFLLPQMRDALMSLDPDFVLLQEVKGLFKNKKQSDPSAATSQVEFLAEKCWPHYLYAKNAIYSSGHHGNAILSKFAFSHFENINLSTINRASRSILHSQIIFNTPNKCTLHLLCIHLGLFKLERQNQIKALINRIQSFVPYHEPLIIAGDFNDWRHSLSKTLAIELNVNEAFYSVSGKHARSYPALKPTLCIDRIYFRGLKLGEVKCLQGKPWRLLSDHLPLLAEFNL